MSLLSFCGKFATWISIAIVLAFIALIALAVFCVGLGAVSSATNPHAAQDTQQETNNYRKISAMRKPGSPVRSGILSAVDPPKKPIFLRFLYATLALYKKEFLVVKREYAP